MIKLLIDGDLLVYQMGFAVQKKDSIEPVEHAYFLINKMLKYLETVFCTTNKQIYLTSDDKSNFRFKIAKTKPYKGNRDKKVNKNAVGRPTYYGQIRDYLIESKRAKVIYDMEADDAMGIEQCRILNNLTYTSGPIKTPKFESVICSFDKDLRMIPGMQYNFKAGVGYGQTDPGEVSIWTNSDTGKKSIYGTCLAWFYAQMLIGDDADNIPGIPGMGPMKTVKLFKDCKISEMHEEDQERAMWEMVQRVYFNRLMPELSYTQVKDRLMEVADLLWIWRKENDCKSKDLKERFGVLKRSSLL